MGKSVPSVLKTALGLRPWAVVKTEGTVFPNTGLPAGKQSIYIYNIDRTLCAL